jgi:hypothetical protein
VQDADRIVWRKQKRIELLALRASLRSQITGRAATVSLTALGKFWRASIPRRWAGTGHFAAK